MNRPWAINDDVNTIWCTFFPVSLTAGHPQPISPFTPFKSSSMLQLRMCQIDWTKSLSGGVNDVKMPIPQYTHVSVSQSLWNLLLCPHRDVSFVQSRVLWSIQRMIYSVITVRDPRFNRASNQTNLSHGIKVFYCNNLAVTVHCLWCASIWAHHYWYMHITNTCRDVI